MISRLLCMLGCLLLSRTCFAEETRRYDVIAETTSPDYHYAVAWGIPGHSRIDFTRLKKEWPHGFSYDKMEWPKRKYSASLGLKDYDDVKQINVFIVDLRTKRILTRLKGITQRQHYEFVPWIHVDWAPNSALVLVINDARKWSVDFCAAALPQTGPVSQCSLVTQFNADMARQLDRIEGAKYRKDLFYVYDSTRLAANGQLSLTASVIDERGTYDPIATGVLSYRLQVASGSLTAVFSSLTGWQKIKTKSPDH